MPPPDCQCPQCTAAPDFLYTDDWRRVCEAAHVLTLDVKQRMEYCKAVGKRRGPEAMAQLIADVKREYAETHR